MMSEARRRATPLMAGDNTVTGRRRGGGGGGESVVARSRRGEGRGMVNESSSPSNTDWSLASAGQ